MYLRVSRPQQHWPWRLQVGSELGEVVPWEEGGCEQPAVLRRGEGEER